MLLYRITYRSAREAHSVVRPLVATPAAGDRIALDAETVVTIREVVPHPRGDTIAADLLAEEHDAADETIATSLASPAEPPSGLA